MKLKKFEQFVNEEVEFEDLKVGMKVYSRDRPNEIGTIELIQLNNVKGMEKSGAIHIKDDKTGKEWRASGGELTIVEGRTFEELNLDMMNAHGIKDGKLEMNKEYLWIEKEIKYGKEERLSPIRVFFKGMLSGNEDWGIFRFQENKNGHKNGEEQKIEISSIYPLDLVVDSFYKPVNYKSKFE
jgi:hypothetical protein